MFGCSFDVGARGERDRCLHTPTTPQSDVEDFFFLTNIQSILRSITMCHNGFCLLFCFLFLFFFFSS